MTRPTRNVIANFAGIGVASGAPLFFNIIYFRLLGSEAFGLVGFHLTGQMIAFALDLGLSRTTTREVARAASRDAAGTSARSIVLTLFTVHAALFLTLGILVVVLSGWVARSWLTTVALDQDTVQLSVALIGAAIALQQPRTIFLSALNGLERQVLTNLLIAGAALTRGGVTLAVLLGSGSIIAFFWAQVILAAAETIAIGAVVWRRLPPGRAGAGKWLDGGLVRRAKGFALADGATVAIGTATLHADKLALSGLVSLEAFGTYGMLSLVAQSLARLPTPFSVAYFPHLVGLWERGHQSAVAEAYRRATYGLTSLLIPAAAVVILFADPLSDIVLGGVSGIQRPALALALLSLGFTAHALLHLPHALQLASGWTRLALTTNVVVFLLYVPLLLALVPAFGLVAAPVLFLLSTLVPLPAVVHLMHRRLLTQERRRWWTLGIAMPVAASCAIVVPARLLTLSTGAWRAVLVGAVSGLVAVAALRQVHPRLRSCGGSRPRPPENPNSLQAPID